jgi:hypothetical protein
MVRRIVSCVLWVGITACTDDESSESLTSFGSMTSAGTGTSAASETASASDTSTSPGTSSTSGTATDPATDAGTSSAGPTSDTTQGETTGDPATGSTGDAELGECIGLGAWTSCTMYCEAILEACVPDGCGGSTVVYYGDIGDCTGQVDGGGSSQACGDAFQTGGGNSFARCCCG